MVTLPLYSSNMGSMLKPWTLDPAPQLVGIDKDRANRYGVTTT